MLSSTKTPPSTKVTLAKGLSVFPTTAWSMIGRLLGHTVAETTKRYSHLEADPVKRATETVGATIAAAMRGETGEVIDMTKAKK